MGEQIRNVSDVIIHEDWNSRGLLENDIAILVLEDPLHFDRYIQPIDVAKGDETRAGNSNDFDIIFSKNSCHVSSFLVA